MIARFRIYLGSLIFLEHGVVYPVKDIEQDGYRIRIHPPEQTSADISNALITASASREELAEFFKPDIPQSPSSAIRINDRPALHGNLLTIDFIKDQFDRRRVQNIQADPPIDLVFAIANQVVAGLRTVSRSSQLEFLKDASTSWRVDYLDDEEQLLPETDGLYRYCVERRYGKQEVTLLTPLLWGRVCSLPSGFVHYTWDTLLLNSAALLPAIGPAIAVANAALETFIPWALEQLCRQLNVDEQADADESTSWSLKGMLKEQLHRQLSAEADDAVDDSLREDVQASSKDIPYNYPALFQDLWTYIFEKEDPTKKPSISDQLDIFITMLTKRSLKNEEPALWEAFQNLRSARHNFMHEGKPIIGKKKNIEVTEERAVDLIAKANAIVSWVETLLPEAVRRPIAVEKVDFSFEKNYRVHIPIARDTE
jgi:hypothetical protein